MKDFKSFHKHGWKLRISVRWFRFKREDNLPKEAEETISAFIPMETWVLIVSDFTRKSIQTLQKAVIASFRPSDFFLLPEG